jgi:hypothetical protein
MVPLKIMMSLFQVLMLLVKDAYVTSADTYVPVAGTYVLKFLLQVLMFLLEINNLVPAAATQIEILFYSPFEWKTLLPDKSF